MIKKLFCLCLFGLLPLLGAQNPGPSVTGAIAASGGGGTVFTHVQSCSGYGSSTATSVTVTCSAVGAGHFLYVLGVTNPTPGDGFSSLSLSGDSGTFTQDFSPCPGSSSEQYMSGYFIPITSGGETSLTVTFNGTVGSQTYATVMIDEWSYTGSTPSVDVSQSGCSTGTGTTAATTAITPTANGDLFIGQAEVYYSGNSISAVPPFVNGAISSTQGTSYYIQSTAAALGTSWTIGSGNQDYGTHITAFK
jgi:hypothetical protein